MHPFMATEEVGGRAVTAEGNGSLHLIFPTEMAQQMDERWPDAENLFGVVVVVVGRVCWW